MSDALEKLRESMLKRPKVVGDFSSCSFANDYPLLFALVSETAFKGKEVKSGSMILFVEDGCWKVCINDRELERTTFVTGSTFPQMLQAVEDGLSSGNLDWRGPRASNGFHKRTR